MNLIFLQNALIIAGISAGLAALITLIDAIVNNYGEVKIDINDGSKEFTVTGGSPLLSTLAENSIFIPSACGGRGTCGACKCVVKTDIGPIYPTEKPYLSDEEMEENTRLSCQIKVKSDLKLEIPEHLFNVKEFETAVESMADVTYDIKEVRFRLNRPDTIKFRAGQYMQLVVPPYDKIKEETQRAYSMQSSPAEKDVVELLIRLVPGGIATTWVFENMNEGDKVSLIGPFGDFFLRDTDAAMICVAGGSGMAPIKSILYDMVNKEMTDREVWYFFGARAKKDLFYIEEFRELEEKWPKFHFVPALSEPEPDDNWDGETGLITEVLDRYFQNTISTEIEREGYLCGSPGMIDACVAVMKKHDMPEEKIYFDKFA